MKGTKEKLKNFILNMPTVRFVAVGYLLYIVFGWLLLELPFSQIHSVSAVDNLFTSASAVSTTGLVTVNVAEQYTLFGQIVILLLIQIGGLGYMTFSSFVLLSLGEELSLMRRDITATVFSIPKRIDIKHFIPKVVIFTFLFEAVGALLLGIIFRSQGVPNAEWNAIFHSVSSFCTAGFSTFTNGLESFTGDYLVCIIVMFLSYIGAMGFIICIDIADRLIGRTKKISVTSKMILSTTLILSVLGTFIILLSEPSIKNMPFDEMVLTSLFQSMTAMTTVGFNTVPIGALSKATILILGIFMVIGASPSGTGGGIKSTSFMTIMGQIRSIFRGKTKVTIFNRILPSERVGLAVATAAFYIIVLMVGGFILLLSEQAPSDVIIFESASALGTVGLSMGLTPSLSIFGKIIITLMMYIGRLGPLTFGLAIFYSRFEDVENIDYSGDKDDHDVNL
jgi:trk system potassium uptake protein TrkH